MNKNIEKIQQRIEPLRDAIVSHKVYGAIEAIADLNLFMQYHVYAVWDFMSLLKSLQNSLTCTTVPWFPKGSADTRFLINEIVVGEESDVDQHGQRKSHFELYLDAMRQSGADISGIETFVAALKATGDLSAAFAAANTPKAARDFVAFTFEQIRSGQDHVQSAIFTFGREDLIPGMFVSLINDLDRNFPGNISIFKYYLERHIEVDGDHHSHLALQMTANLCGDGPGRWAEAEAATVAALQRRIALWDGAYDAVMERRLEAVEAG